MLGALEALTTGTIEQAVTSLDSAVDLVRAGVVVDLPQAKAHEGHFVAAAQLDNRRRHVCGGACFWTGGEGGLGEEERKKKRNSSKSKSECKSI